MITELMFALLVGVSFICLFFALQYKSIVSGAVAAILFLFIAAICLAIGVDVPRGHLTGVIERCNCTELIVNQTTYWGKTSVIEEITLYQNVKNIYAGIIFILFGAFMCYDITTYAKDKRRNDDERESEVI